MEGIKYTSYQLRLEGKAFIYLSHEFSMNELMEFGYTSEGEGAQGMDGHGNYHMVNVRGEYCFI